MTGKRILSLFSGLSLISVVVGCAHCPYPAQRAINPGEVELRVHAEQAVVREDQQIRLIVEQRNVSARSLIFDWYPNDHVTIEQCGNGRKTESYFPGNRGVIVTDSHKHVIESAADRIVGPGKAMIDTLPIAFLSPERYRFIVHLHRQTVAATYDASCEDTVTVKALSCGEVASMVGHDDKVLERILYSIAGRDSNECARLLTCIGESDSTWLTMEGRQYLKSLLIDRMKVK